MTALKVLRRNVAGAVRPVPAVIGAYRWNRDRAWPHVHAFVLDGLNRARYGPEAPRYAERLWVDPTRVQHYIRGLRGSGRVVSSWPPAELKPIEDDFILRVSIDRWVHGLTWEETGEVERMMEAIARKGPLKGCRTRADVLRRCARLDDVFRVIERESRVRPQGEVEPGVFRELGGIGMHIGPDGVPVRATNGRHRFAMARILQLPLIPVRIGMVHRSAISRLPQLRHY